MTTGERIKALRPQKFSEFPLFGCSRSLTLPTDESGGFPFQRVPLEKIKAYILSVGV